MRVHCLNNAFLSNVNGTACLHIAFRNNAEDLGPGRSSARPLTVLLRPWLRLSPTKSTVTAGCALIKSHPSTGT